MKKKVASLLAAGVFTLLLVSGAFAANVTWSGSGDGVSWSDPNNWNGGVLPRSSDNATIGVVSGNPTIQITGTLSVVQINSLTSSEPINISSGTIRVATTIQVSQNITLSGGAIQGGAITTSGNAAFTASSGTLNGVTLDSNLTVSGSLTVTNGLTLNNATVTLASTGTDATLYFYRGVQRLSGSGQIILGGTSSNNYVYLGHGGGPTTLTVAPGITIQGRGAIYGSTSIYSLVDEFSNAYNPNGVWSYNQGNAPLVYQQFNWGGTITNSLYWTTTPSGTVPPAWTKSVITQPGWHDWQPGDVAVHSTNFSSASNSLANVTWTSPGAGTVSIDGSAWNAEFYSGRDASWQLYVNGTLYASRSSIYSVFRIAPEASFHNNLQSGKSLQNIAVAAGDVVMFEVESASTYGHYTGVDIHVTFVPTGSFPSTLINQGTINADVGGNALSVSPGGTFTNSGTLKATGGGSLDIAGLVITGSTSGFSSDALSTISLTGSLTGNTTSVAGFTPAGTTIIRGGAAASPQLLEAMGQNAGNVPAGFGRNFDYGTLALANNTYVKLVDQFHNSPGTGAEAVYAQSVIVPASSTLDLNGIHLYARGVQVWGTVLNGAIVKAPMNLATPTPGSISAAGQLDEWTFFDYGGRAVTIEVNPGSSGSPVPLSPLLQWANVQLLDSNNNVLASGSDTSAGAIVTLSNVVLPADGTYKIHINAAASDTSATGNYIVSVWDGTPNVQSLNIGEQAAGNIATPFALDQWNFSAMAGQQVQFHLVGASSSGVAFKLTGPGNYVAFQDITSDSTLINLPSSGAYTLSAYSLNGATGTYSFVMNQTSVTPLPSGTPYHGAWAGSGQAQLFAIPVTAAGPLAISLNDPTGGDHTELYARFGAPPTRQTYDYGANGAGSSQFLLVPSAAAGTWYVLVYGESIPSSSGSFTLQASSGEVVLAKTSTTQSATNVATILNLTGAGFKSGSVVSLVSSSGATYAATSSATDLPTLMTATFASGSVPAGTYSIKVTQPDGSSAQLPGAITFAPSGQGVLSVHMEVPNPIGRPVANTFYVDYANTGTAPMPAPLLEITAFNSAGGTGAAMALDTALEITGFYTAAEALPAGFTSTIQVLASGSTPGILAPGESARVPIVYVGWWLGQWDFGPVTFSVTSIQPGDTTPVNWPSMESSLQPSGVSSAAWNVMYSSLLLQLGTTAGGFVQMLDNEATYLAGLGQNVTDISKLWSFAVAQTENVWPLPTLGSTVDDSLPTSGALSLSFGRAFNQTVPGRFQSGPLGFGWFTPWQQSLSFGPEGVTLTTGNGTQFIYQPDSRYPGQYFSQPGDYNTFTAVSGGYQLTAANGTITAFNSNGTLNYLQDTNGNTITAAYSGATLTSLKAPSGQSLTLAYNAAGRISTLTDFAGRVTAYAYDVANQHLMSVTGYEGKTTSYTYNTTSGSPAQNSLASITFPDATHQYFTYDSQGRLASTYADGNAMSKTFTYSTGQVAITDATPSTWSLYFDQNGQLAKAMDALGNPIYFSHDSTFDLVGVTNTLGASAAYNYNSVGEVTSATDFLGNTTNLTYGGPQNQLLGLTDAKGNTTIYTYNTTGNLLSTTYANGKGESTTYDPFGNALSFVNPAGQPTQYVHNTAGQLTSATFSDGSSFSYVYDNQGRLHTATDATGTTNFTYDPITGFLTKVSYPNSTSLTFSYDAGGRRNSMVDQSGFTTNYFYDSVGRLYQLKDASNNVIVTYAYDANGRLQQKTNGNGTYTTYQYDGNGNVLHLINYAPGGTVNSRFDDTYNTVGLKATETTLDGAWTYAYDGNSQLVLAVFTSNNPGSIPNQNLAYNYDAMGNRTYTVINGATTAYVTNNMNQYTSVGGMPYSYDANGNLLADGSNAYAYNALNTLSSATSGSGTTTYAYNAMGQRVSSATGDQTTQYLIDPAGLGNVTATYDGSGSLIAHYTQGFGLTSQISPNSALYYDFDSLGSAAGMSNSTGFYVNKYSYLPFGSELSSSVTVPNIFQFVGRYGVQHESSGVNFMRGRYYAANPGRFTQTDPLEISGGDLNLYRYANNAPTVYVDPSGLSFLEIVNEGLNSVYDVIDRIVDTLNYGLEHGYITPQDLGNTSYLLFNPNSNWMLGANSPDAQNNPYLQHYFHPNQTAPTPQLTGTSTGPNTTVNTVSGEDPNAMYGPAGYGTANFVQDTGGFFPYRVTFENDPTATAPAQSVTITDNLNPNLDWTTFQLAGIGFGDKFINIPAGRQHFQTTVSMTYNGETFNVQIEAGIHSATGQVYAIFQSIDPKTSLPPANVLTGFLPPEDGTGRGSGYLTYTVSPKANLATGTVIPNVANIVFDRGEPIATNLVSDTNPSLGTDPTKEAPVTIDANVPTSKVTALPSYVPASFNVSWSGTDSTGGSGIASYTVYVSSNGGKTFTPWLTNTQLTSGTYTGVAGNSYSFYVVATSNVGTVQTSNLQTAAVSTQSLTALNYWRWQNFNIPSNTGIAADTATPYKDGISNLLKYGLVIPPGMSDPGLVPVPKVVSYPDGNRLTLIFTNDPSRNDITVQVQTAGSPAGPWTTVASSINGAMFRGNGFVSETPAAGGQMTEQVRDVVNITNTPRFMRVLVTH